MSYFCETIKKYNRRYNHGGYFFAILSAIANGDNTIPRLTQAMGESGVTGH